MFYRYLVYSWHVSLLENAVARYQKYNILQEKICYWVTWSDNVENYMHVLNEACYISRYKPCEMCSNRQGSGRYSSRWHCHAHMCKYYLKPAKSTEHHTTSVCLCVHPSCCTFHSLSCTNLEVLDRTWIWSWLQVFKREDKSFNFRNFTILAEISTLAYRTCKTLYLC